MICLLGSDCHACIIVDLNGKNFLRAFSLEQKLINFFLLIIVDVCYLESLFRIW